MQSEFVSNMCSGIQLHERRLGCKYVEGGERQRAQDERWHWCRPSPAGPHITPCEPGWCESTGQDNGSMLLNAHFLYGLSWDDVVWRKVAGSGAQLPDLIARLPVL
eukprot:359747-Chlamydomonas_euryale.AAC.5